MANSAEKLPEWMLKLENKRKKQHRLAHDIGAGAPCLACGDNCPGLDLHFWRKLCRNCKCKKEDHDVKDDEGYEQFEILLGSGSRKHKKGGFLNIKVPGDTQNPVVSQNASSKGVSFDWLPPNVSEEVAAEYMQQLPASKLPISGSDGALYRRQQLTKQVPLHDLDAKHCHNLTTEEIEEFMKYLDNLKSNVVGQGCVGKVSTSSSGVITAVPGVEHFYTVDQVTGRQLITSQSADPIRPLPPMPPAYNSMPRPFHASASSSAYGSGEDEDLPPPLPTSLPPRTDLKIPSEFMPDWRLPEDHVFGKVMEGVQEMQLNQSEFPSYIKESFASGTTTSSAYDRQQPQFSSNLSQPQPSSSRGVHHEQILSQAGLPQTFHQENLQSLESDSRLKIQGQHSAAFSGSGLEHPVRDKQTSAFFGQDDHNPTQEALSGARVPTGVAMSIKDVNTESVTSFLPADSTQVSSLHSKGIASSIAVDRHGASMMSKPLSGLKNIDSSASSLNRTSDSGGSQLSASHSSFQPPNASNSPNPSGSGIRGPPKLHSQTPLLQPNVGGSLSSASDNRGGGLSASDLHTSHLPPSQGSSLNPPGSSENVGLHPHNSQVSHLPLNATKGSGIGVSPTNDGQTVLPSPNAAVTFETVGGIRSIAEPLKGRKTSNNSGINSSSQESQDDDNHINSLSGHGPGKQSLQQTTHLNYGRPGLNQHILAPSLPVEGVKTSSIIGFTVAQSNSVATDALPKSAQMMQQQPTLLDPTSITAFPGSAAPLTAETPGGSAAHLDCRECGLKLLAGDVAVFAERAGSAAWHPSCFVCSTCKELLVDLMYFYHKSNVYCGRHFAELMGIPRCFACDELIFVKAYTVAEGKAYHVKHFCCYECDDPLADKQYVLVEDQPVCLECFQRKYGKMCHTCKNKIAAGEQRIGWKHLNWHVQGNCFRCYECAQSLLGGRFVVKEDQPFCSKECVQVGLQKMAGAA